MRQQATTTSKAMGLQFRKLDLHIHTPASSDFVGAASAAEIVQQALAVGLDAIAITDHNSGAWIDDVKKAAANTTLTVFPGVEITCAQGKSNIHVIALFDPERDTAYVSAMLNKLDLVPDMFGNPNALINKTVIEVIETIQQQYGGIAVLAHANSSSGVLCDMRGNQRTQIIQHSSLMAVESTDYFNDNKRMNKKRVVDLLDGTDPTFERALAVYEASDNPTPGNQHGHSVQGIGTRFTYFKMESIDIDSLRQCLLDPTVRIRFITPTEPVHPQIRRISISGGFLDGETVIFHGGMNSILGGKGVGKSALVEFLRFALGQPPTSNDILADHLGKLEALLGTYGTVTIEFVDGTGKTYEYSTTLRNGGVGERKDIEFDPAEVLPVLFLSQNEIIRLAENEAAQLAFIDRFFDFRIFKRQIESAERELSELDLQMADSLRAFHEYRELQPQVSTLKEEVDQLERSLDSEIFQRFQSADNKRVAIEEQLHHLDVMRTRIQTVATAYDGLEIPEISIDLAEDPVLLRNRDAIAIAKGEVELALKQALDRLRVTEEQVEAQRQSWIERFEVARNEYDEHVKTAGGDYKVLARKRDVRQREYTTLLRRTDVAKKRRESITSISSERDRLLDSIDQAYTSYTSARQSRCNEIETGVHGRLQLRIVPSSNTTAFRSRLLSLKQGSYLREEEIDTICKSISPRQFIWTLLRHSVAPESEKISGKLLEPLTTSCDIPLARLIRLADFLLEGIKYEQLLELQYRAAPQDRPEILFNVGDGEYRPLAAVSVGQKSVALLLMALSEGDSPVVIDQPEDSLDMRAIWEDICSKLRQGKETRQFIFTTHNASVAVASDSDYFIVLDGNASHGSVVHFGSMDHEPVSTQVLTYLEGGIETYRKKFAKYRVEQQI